MIDEQALSLFDVGAVSPSGASIAELIASGDVKGIRGFICSMEDKVRALPGAVYDDFVPGVKFDDCFEFKHSFGEGLYVREMNIPAGVLMVTKIHKKAHPLFIIQGDCSILAIDGVHRVQPPFYMITPAGTKRVIYTHADTKLVTVHATLETDLDKIEEEIIAKTFDDVPDPNVTAFTDRFRKLTKDIVAHEKDGFWSDWTPEQRELYRSGDWEAFSRSRGYSEEEITDYRLWIDMREDGLRLGIDVYEIIRDLSMAAAIRNIKKDTNGEFLLSSHTQFNKKIREIKGDVL
jgi:hypothetical protein